MVGTDLISCNFSANFFIKFGFSFQKPYSLYTRAIAEEYYRVSYKGDNLWGRAILSKFRRNLRNKIGDALLFQQNASPYDFRRNCIVFVQNIVLTFSLKTEPDSSV